MARFAITLLIVTILVWRGEAGIRCSFGNAFCTAGCVLLGQTSGVCDDEGTCFCSEKSISLDDFKKLLPSRCSLGESFCEGTCNSIGRKGGVCERKDGILDCKCDDKYLTPKQFGLCAAESTCRLDCQKNGKSTGQCNGWNCECLGKPNSTDTSKDATSSVEFEWWSIVYWRCSKYSQISITHLIQRSYLVTANLVSTFFNFYHLLLIFRKYEKVYHKFLW